MEIIEVEDGPRPKFHAGNFIGRRTRASMVPWANDEKMFRPRFRRDVRHMIAIECERAQLIAIVLTCDCQNRQRDLLALLGRRHYRVVVGVGRGMFQDALEIL